MPDNVVTRLKQKRAYRGPTPADISPVERGVPIPPKPSIYPFAEMDVGDSFTLPADRVSTMKSNLTRWRRDNKEYRRRKFIWRAEGDRIRVWRTS